MVILGFSQNGKRGTLRPFRTDDRASPECEFRGTRVGATKSSHLSHSRFFHSVLLQALRRDESLGRLGEQPDVSPQTHQEEGTKG